MYVGAEIEGVITIGRRGNTGQGKMCRNEIHRIRGIDPPYIDLTTALTQGWPINTPLHIEVRRLDVPADVTDRCGSKTNPETSASRPSKVDEDAAALSRSSSESSGDGRSFKG